MRSSLNALIACGLLTLAPTIALGADHQDSPAAVNDPAADINDVYSFINPKDASELVLVATVNPIANPATRFSDAVLYNLNLTNGAGVDNRIQCTFTLPDEAWQRARATGLNPPEFADLRSCFAHC